MHKSNHQSIRMLLQQYHDGLTNSEIAERLDKDASHTKRALSKMPDVYIDRWITHRKQWTAVWCVVVPPQNCPKPTDVKTVKLLKNERTKP